MWKRAYLIRKSLKRALKWVKENCTEQEDTVNAPEYRRSAEQREADWEYVVKMVLIGKDLMIGNPKLKETGIRRRISGT